MSCVQYISIVLDPHRFIYQTRFLKVENLTVKDWRSCERVENLVVIRSMAPIEHLLAVCVCVAWLTEGACLRGTQWIRLRRHAMVISAPLPYLSSRRHAAWGPLVTVVIQRGVQQSACKQLRSWKIFGVRWCGEVWPFCHHQFNYSCCVAVCDASWWDGEPPPTHPSPHSPLSTALTTSVIIVISRTWCQTYLTAIS